MNLSTPMQTFLPRFIGLILNTLGLINTKLASKWALDLFSRPLKGRYKTIHPTLEAAEKRNFHFKKLAIKTYRWKGEKETALKLLPADAPCAGASKATTEYPDFRRLLTVFFHRPELLSQP